MNQEHNINIIRGATFFLEINLKQKDSVGQITPFDATGLGLRGKIKRSFKSVNSWDFSFNIIDLSIGKFEVIMGADVTEMLPIGTLVYDVEVFDPLDNTIVYKAAFGKATVENEVTRS